eukprot:TRINITY_DN1432_c0_g1_i4.p2 TRINITY_DN1432_c0_g1~~TRINITY_DN1432_c0_g1_i4.p2  ORF type:complete len:142 (-),score=47.73 TRINITY_DN1432_c0_g1_i4:318-743(-)
MVGLAIVACLSLASGGVAEAGAVAVAAQSAYASFLVGVVGAQQFHQWSHAVQGVPPAAIVAARARLIVGRKDHGRHHVSPYGGVYGIVSGWCNAPADRFEVWRRAEVAVWRLRGVEPICGSWTGAVRERAFDIAGGRRPEE